MNNEIKPDHYGRFSMRNEDELVAIYGPACTALFFEMNARKYFLRAGAKEGQDLETEIEKGKRCLELADKYDPGKKGRKQLMSYDFRTDVDYEEVKCSDEYRDVKGIGIREGVVKELLKQEAIIEYPPVDGPYEAEPEYKTYADKGMGDVLSELFGLKGCWKLEQGGGKYSVWIYLGTDRERPMFRCNGEILCSRIDMLPSDWQEQLKRAGYVPCV